MVPLIISPFLKQLVSPDISRFVQAGVAFSRTYVGGIPRLFASDLAQTNRADNFFFRQGGTAQYYIYEVDGKILGRVGAFINPDLHENGAQVGSVGMFDCIENYDIATELLNAATAWLRGHDCGHIWGPMDFSIWHNYRFMTQGFGSRGFLGEPRNPEYYPTFFEEYGFSVRTTWESQVLDVAGIAAFIEENKRHLALFYELGYTFERITKANQVELMRNTYRVLIESYRSFPGFCAISEQDFLQHFRHMPDILDADCSQFIKNPDGKFFAFLLIFKDLYRPLSAMNGSTNFWAKLKYLLYRNQTNMANIAQGGTVPFFIREAAILSKKHGGQPLSLGGATICQALESIVNTQKYEQVIISLMRQGAAVKNHAIDVAVEKREYALYELKNNPLNSSLIITQ